jgi:hypothetical protein
MTFQPRNVDQHRLVRLHNALDALRDQRIYATDSDDFLRLQFSHPDQVIWKVTFPVPVELPPWGHLRRDTQFNYLGTPIRTLSNNTIRNLRAGTALPRKKHELKVLRNNLKTWGQTVAYWNSHIPLMPNWRERTSELFWTFRNPPSQVELDALKAMSIAELSKRIHHDLAIATLCPMMAPELREYFVGKGWRCYRRTFVLKQKMKVLDELRTRHAGLRIKMFRRSLLKVLDETRLPTDCGILITQFLLPEDPE